MTERSSVADRIPEAYVGPSTGPRLGAAGKYFFEGPTRLRLRGATYGTFRPGADGEPYPAQHVVTGDFAAMRAAGLNALRTYTVPPPRVLDAAERHGLRVLVGLPWTQHVSFFEDRRQARAIAASLRAGAASCAGHPAVLGFAVGNEIPSEIVRWSGRRRTQAFIRELYEAAKDEAPDALVTYANYPPTEYLDLSFLDFLAFNVYLESAERFRAYLARLHHHAGDRPLVMTEIGFDSRRHGEVGQARALQEQVVAAEEGGCAGSFVFAWTDEWHRGGRHVEDWDFGLTTRDRTPKPALAGLAETFRRPAAPPPGGWPRVSVVVCAYNAAATLGRCLAGLQVLEYPDVEILVVDDGSSDGTSQIASCFDVRLVRTPNQGLSRARNTGIRAATGEIVAFIDADAWPERDWLTHLVRGLRSGGFEAIGGPNVAPPGDGPVAACVANAPGGPVHVMLTDDVAEHVPGCNMAFRKEALEAIGGFDPRFRVAGDDVDVCWRIQDRGWRIGFAPGGMVWHHARSTVGGYWRQQRGYGAAEALLEAKWPEKYNALGHVTWGGRVYGRERVLLPFRPGRIYGGTWGQAAYQHLEPASSGLLWDAAAMPEWYLVLLVLAVLAGLGFAWTPLLVALPLLLGGVGLTVGRALLGGLRARFPGEPRERGRLLRLRALTALLHLLQPLARLRGRLVRGLVPWRLRVRASRVVWPGHWRLTLWKERGEALPRVLALLEAGVASTGTAVRRGGSYDAWDLQIEGGTLGSARLRSCVEWHGEGRQLLRFAVIPMPSAAAWWATAVPMGLGLWAVADGAVGVATVLAGLAVAVATRALWECAASTAALVDAARRMGRVTAAERSTVRVRPAAAEPAPAERGGPETVRAAG